MKKTTTLLLALTATLGTFSAHADSIDSTDWITDSVFTNGVEGPAVASNGDLYAVNFGQQGTIGRVFGKDDAELFITLPTPSTGNGIRFDQQGNMYIADYVGHNVLKVAMPSKTVTVHAHNPKMNQPNDLAIADNGNLYASDPNWAKSSGQLWLIKTNGSTVLLDGNMGTTNGVEVSPNQQHLYVNESVQRNVWRFDIQADGTVNNKTLFYRFEDFGMDGMRTDQNGNLYIARYGAGKIAVISPQGKLIKQYQLKGQHPTNVAFGGKDGKQLFVTMQKRGAIETIPVDVAGRSFSR